MALMAPPLEPCMPKVRIDGLVRKLAFSRPETHRGMEKHERMPAVDDKSAAKRVVLYEI